MAIIKQLNKKTGITYVYESHSYRDKETKQPRSTRRLIGKIDEETGEIIPTRKKNVTTTTTADAADIGIGPEEPAGIPVDEIRQKDAQITALRREVARLQKEKAELADALEKLAAQIRDS